MLRNFNLSLIRLLAIDSATQELTRLSHTESLFGGEDLFLTISLCHLHSSGALPICAFIHSQSCVHVFDHGWMR